MAASVAPTAKQTRRKNSKRDRPAEPPLGRRAVVFTVVAVALSAALYVRVLHLIHPVLGPTSTDYYNYLISAFRNGRLDLVGSGTYDLSHYADKWYMYWGATPALFVLPFYVLGHLQTSDVLYGCVAGVLNVVVFAGCVSEFVRYFRMSVSPASRAFLILCFATASPNFFLSFAGSVWFVNQLVSVLYLLVYYYFLLRFLNRHRVLDLTLAAIFFVLAWNARLSLIFHGLLILYALAVTYYERRDVFWRAVPITALVGLAGLGWFGWYNEARFGNPLEIGYRFQTPAARFAAEFAANHMFALSHIPHNATYYFLNQLQLRFEPPYLSVDQEGNSIFSVYPLTILAFLFFKRNVYDRRNVWFFVCLGAALAINFGVILLDLGTGWVQFGSRYALDVLPGLFLLILFVVERVKLPLKVIVLAYGILVNYVGVLVYFGLIQWKT
jgi:hypothetical protein